MGSDSVGEPVEIVSPLSAEQCARRLQALIDPPRLLFGRKPVIGRIDELQVHARKRIEYRNPFQTHLSAEFKSEADCTRIHCRFVLSPFETILVAALLSHALLISGTMLAIFLVILFWSRFQPPAAASLLVIGPLLVLAFGFGLPRIGRYVARNERHFLLECVRSAVSGQQVCHQANGSTPP